MDKKAYYIYKCLAKRKDNTEIERVFKMPYFWSYETLAVALITTCDCSGLIESIYLDNNGLRYIFNDKYYKGKLSYLRFKKLEDKNINITINYEDNISILFVCEKVGEELSNKNIVRKTPILVSSKGYNRLTKEEYFNEDTLYIKPIDSYENLEELHLNWIKSDITRLFTYFLGSYFE